MARISYANPTYRDAISLSTFTKSCSRHRTAPLPRADAPVDVQKAGLRLCVCRAFVISSTSPSTRVHTIHADMHWASSELNATHTELLTGAGDTEHTASVFSQTSTRLLLPTGLADKCQSQHQHKRRRTHPCALLSYSGRCFPSHRCAARMLLRVVIHDAKHDACTSEPRSRCVSRDGMPSREGCCLLAGIAGSCAARRGQRAGEGPGAARAKNAAGRQHVHPARCTTWCTRRAAQNCDGGGGGGGVRAGARCKGSAGRVQGRPGRGAPWPCAGELDEALPRKS